MQPHRCPRESSCWRRIRLGERNRESFLVLLAVVFLYRLLLVLVVLFLVAVVKKVLKRLVIAFALVVAWLVLRSCACRFVVVTGVLAHDWVASFRVVQVLVLALLLVFQASFVPCHPILHLREYETCQLTCQLIVGVLESIWVC